MASVAPRLSRPTARRLAYPLRQAIRLAVSAWVLVTLSFLLVHFIPGDPVRASLGLTAPAELVEARRVAVPENTRCG